jgi:uncharacterized protein YndB with AHSA1/START domain
MTVGTEPIVKEIRIDASPETVFGFFTEPEKLTRWLAKEATVDPRPGGINHQTHFFEGRDYSMRGEFVELAPPHRVVFTWGFEDDDVGVKPGTSTVEVTLEPDSDGTLLRLVHRDLPEAQWKDHDEGWGELLPQLAKVAAEA